MLSDPHLDRLVEFSNRMADEARTLIRDIGTSPRGVALKPDRSFVTDLDLAIESRLRDMIADAWPEHGILGEERGAEGTDREFVWVLDPIDGTAPFIAGMPVYGTLIALMHDRKPLLGLMDQPETARRWLGVSGRPTVMNAQPCRTRRCADLGMAIVSVCNPDAYAAQDVPVLHAMRDASAWRIYGAACLSLGLLATGRTDLHLDTGYKTHDLAPYAPIVEGAGGRVTDWEGAPLTLDSGPSILAVGDPGLHDAALRLIEAARSA